MPNNESKYGRRFDEEFRREVAALACRPGAKLEQVARDLGVSPWSVSRWKKQYGGGHQNGSAPVTTAPVAPARAWPNWSGASRRSNARTRTCASNARS